MSGTIVQDPNSAAGAGFFDRHPRFEATSTVASDLPRLNFRHHLIIERNRALIAGRRMLDIASHDGRFSLAALDAGASHVTGIEVRDGPIAAAHETFAHYGVDPARYAFVQGDVFERLAAMTPGAFDTALVLGFLYHTPRQYELFAALARLGVADLIIDSQVLPNFEAPVVLLRWEGTEKDGQIWDAARPRVLSAIPSQAALEYYMQEFGWTVQTVAPTVPIPPSARVYRTGKRVTLTGRRA